MGIIKSTSTLSILLFCILLGLLSITSSHQNRQHRRHISDPQRFDHPHIQGHSSHSHHHKGYSRFENEAAYKDFHWGNPGDSLGNNKHSKSFHACTSLDKERHRYRFEDSISNLYVGNVATRSRRRQNRDRRHVNDTPHKEKAVQFSGIGETLILDNVRTNFYRELTGHFTVEVWVRPEGGQFSPVSIVGESCLQTLDHNFSHLV